MAQTVTTAGALLREWREAASMKLDRAAVYASDLMGQDISSEKVRRYETGVPPEAMDPLVVAALVEVYGKALHDLPEELRTKVEHARNLLSRLSAWVMEDEQLVSAA
jgi:antitoxin component HigA of HigAB toxin-antitoxin module